MNKTIRRLAAVLIAIFMISSGILISNAHAEGGGGDDPTWWVKCFWEFPPYAECGSVKCLDRTYYFCKRVDGYLGWCMGDPVRCEYEQIYPPRWWPCPDLERDCPFST